MEWFFMVHDVKLLHTVQNFFLVVSFRVSPSVINL